jgi:ABC-type Fe3+-siderophore transport system permease subunit
LIVDAQPTGSYSWNHFFLYMLCGILAVPLAPVSKDLASALSTGVKVAQALRR